MSAVPPSWAAYVPDQTLPWDRRRACHLHRRAAFGAPPEVVLRDVADSPQAAVDRLLAGCATADASSPFEQTATLIGNAAVESGNADRLKAWWLYRCLFSPAPLVERQTLMWHNHFATSNAKVDDLKLMKRQNETFRRNALAPFGRLLAEMARDPALLEWLDAPSNQKGKPNENLARELLELFSLGIGNYTEQDVKETARALTGRTVRDRECYERLVAHDDGEKTCFGNTGRWNGNDVVRLLVEHPATSKRLAWRLTSEFFGEGVISQSALDELASGLREHNLDVGWGLSTILRSRLFFSEANIATRVCDPVTFLLAPLRSLELTRDPPSTLILADWLGRMGQDLFYPPNVGGWGGGRSWLSTRTAIARTNYVTTLAEGKLSAAPAVPELPRLLGLRSMPATEELIDELALRLFGDRALPAIERIKSKIVSNPDKTRCADAIIAVMTCPLTHLN